MDSPTWVLAALNTTAFLLCVSFLLYVFCILKGYRGSKGTVPGVRSDFAWHYVVPCLNEEQVLEGTVRHLTGTFPEATIWCVDDGSTDRTPQILARLQAELPMLRVVTRRPPFARQGKGAALNAAYAALCSELAQDPGPAPDQVLIGVVDADGRLDVHCPDVLAGPTMFGDHSVSAVQVRVRVTNDVDALASTRLDVLAARVDGRRDPLLVQLQDVEFSGPIAAMQMLRRRTGSVGMGGNGQFTRLSALDRIALEFGTPWHGALLEDFELGLHVLLTGGVTEYCHDTWVAQAGLERLRPLMRQRSRWSQGGMQCSKYLWKVLSCSRIGLAGALEIAYYLWVPWSQILGTVVFPITIAVDAWYAFAGTAGGPAEWITRGAWALLPLSLVFGILPHLMWGPLHRAHEGSNNSWARALLLGLANIAYSYLLVGAAWWALWRMLRGRHDWKKTLHEAPGTRFLATSARSTS